MVWSVIWLKSLRLVVVVVLVLVWCAERRVLHFFLTFFLLFLYGIYLRGIFFIYGFYFFLSFFEVLGLGSCMEVGEVGGSLGLQGGRNLSQNEREKFR